jgi:hypothetical protein
MGKSHSENRETEAVIGGVAEEVQRIGLQRHGSAHEAGDALDQEHAGIDGQRDPQDAAEAGVARRRVVLMLAAGGGHLILVALRLGHMLEHVDDDATNMIVGCGVEYLLAMALGAHDAGGAQQTQVMADQRGAEVEPVGDLPHRCRRIQTSQDDAQARGIAEQAEQVCELGRMLIGEQQGRAGRPAVER